MRFNYLAQPPLKLGHEWRITFHIYPYFNLRWIRLVKEAGLLDIAMILLQLVRYLEITVRIIYTISYRNSHDIDSYTRSWETSLILFHIKHLSHKLVHSFMNATSSFNESNPERSLEMAFGN